MEKRQEGINQHKKQSSPTTQNKKVYQNMELKNIITLKTIIEEDGFGKAADKLGYTQSTITFQMRQLEEELGVQLFEKIGRKMVLTQQGKSVIPYVDETLASLERLKNAGKETEQLQGELNIIMADTLVCFRSQKVIAEFKKLAPNVRIRLRSMTCFETRQALSDGSADIGVFYDQQEKDDRLSVHSLGQVSLSLVASPELPQEERDFLTKNQKKTTSFIIDEPSGIFRQLFEQYVKDNNIVMGNTIELWSIGTIKNMVMSNLGVTYGPTFTVEKELEQGKLIELPIDIKAEKLRVIYAYHKNKYISKQMSLFLSLVEKYMKF